jgi:TPR repeat protein
VYESLPGNMLSAANDIDGVGREKSDWLVLGMGDSLLSVKRCLNAIMRLCVRFYGKEGSFVRRVNAVLMVALFVAGHSAAVSRDRFLLSEAELGSVTAQVKLGKKYADGDGVQRDLKQSVYWFQQAAGQGNVEAMFEVGRAYIRGAGVEANHPEAGRWLRAAAERGHTEAQFNLGVMYDKGFGYAVNAAEAVHWYRSAAEAGYAAAQYNLGLCYSNGTGVKTDPSMAATWYAKAAAQGDADAQFNLGSLYWKGRGVELNQKLAEQFYRKAAAQGHDMAAGALEEIAAMRLAAADTQASVRPDPAPQASDRTIEVKGHPFVMTIPGDWKAYVPEDGSAILQLDGPDDGMPMIAVIHDPENEHKSDAAWQEFLPVFAEAMAEEAGAEEGHKLLASGPRDLGGAPNAFYAMRMEVEDAVMISDVMLVATGHSIYRFMSAADANEPKHVKQCKVALESVRLKARAPSPPPSESFFLKAPEDWEDKIDDLDADVRKRHPDIVCMFVSPEDEGILWVQRRPRDMDNLWQVASLFEQDVRADFAFVRSPEDLNSGEARGYPFLLRSYAAKVQDREVRGVGLFTVGKQYIYALFGSIAQERDDLGEACVAAAQSFYVLEQ